MATIELTGRINEAGDLEVQLPDGLPTGEVKIIIEVRTSQESSTVRTLRSSLLGLCADLGPAPSAEDIDKTRREMLADFPVDDLGPWPEGFTLRREEM